MGGDDTAARIRLLQRKRKAARVAITSARIAIARARRKIVAETARFVRAGREIEALGGKVRR